MRPEVPRFKLCRKCNRTSRGGGSLPARFGVGFSPITAAELSLYIQRPAYLSCKHVVRRKNLHHRRSRKAPARRLQRKQHARRSPSREVWLRRRTPPLRRRHLQNDRAPHHHAKRSIHATLGCWLPKIPSNPRRAQIPSPSRATSKSPQIQRGTPLSPGRPNVLQRSPRLDMPLQRLRSSKRPTRRRPRRDPRNSRIRRRSLELPYRWRPRRL